MDEITRIYYVFGVLVPTVMAVLPATLLLYKRRRWLGIALVAGGIFVAVALPRIVFALSPPVEPNDDWVGATFASWPYAFWYCVLCAVVVATLREIDRPNRDEVD